MADVRLVLESNNETGLQPSTFHGIYTLGRCASCLSVFHCTHPIEPGVVVRLLPHGCRVHGAGSNPAKTAKKAKKLRSDRPPGWCPLNSGCPRKRCTAWPDCLIRIRWPGTRYWVRTGKIHKKAKKPRAAWALWQSPL